MGENGQDSSRKPSPRATSGDERADGGHVVGAELYERLIECVEDRRRAESEHAAARDQAKEMKKKLRPSSFTGKPILYTTKKTPKLNNAFELSQWDRSEGKNKFSREKYRHDEHSHPLDASRYFLMGISGHNKITWG